MDEPDSLPSTRKNRHVSFLFIFNWAETELRNHSHWMVNSGFLSLSLSGSLFLKKHIWDQQACFGPGVFSQIWQVLERHIHRLPVHAKPTRMVNLISLLISGAESPSAWCLHGKQTQSHHGKELLGKSRCVPPAFSFITYKWDVHVSLSEKRKSMLALCPSFWARLFSRELHHSPDSSSFLMAAAGIQMTEVFRDIG